MNTTIRTIRNVSKEIQQGQLKPTDLLEEIIRRYRRTEPQIQSWVMVDFDRAREECKQCEREISRGIYRGPLHGIPLGVKDIIDVFDWPTAAGSNRWSNCIARQDAEVVKSLRRAGAVLVGKTVTTQFASYDPSRTRNPWNLERTPGGSSSGSAAAVATGTCLGALASQTGGSITRPAAYCGVSCYKPTLGRISTSGVVPLAFSMDHIGVMAQTVDDLHILFSSLVLSRNSSSWRTVDKPFLHGKRPRIGRFRGLFFDQADSATRDRMVQCEDNFRRAGATIVDMDPPAAFGEINSLHATVMAVEAALYHGERLRRYPEDYAPNIQKLLEIGLSCPAPEYARCKQAQLEFVDMIAYYFQDLDALWTPSATGPAPTRETTGNPIFNAPWSFLGLPTIGLPAGFSPERLPLAIQLVGSRGEDEKLFQVASWCEEQLGWELQMPPCCGMDHSETIE